MNDYSIDPELFGAALRASGDIAYMWDVASDRMTFYGDAAATLFGADRISDGAAFQSHINAEDQPRRRQILAGNMADGGHYDCEYRLRLPDGEFSWVHDRGQVETGPDGKPSRMTGILRVVTERKAREERHRERAVYDTLTGHYNFPRLRDALDHALLHARRYGTEGGYLVVGVEGVVNIAAKYGKAVTDAVVLAAGQRLEECMRTADLIGRLDDHRFGVVLSHCTAAGLAAAAEKITATVSRDPVATAAGPIRVAISVGGVLFPTVATTTTGAMVRGDEAHDQATRNPARHHVLNHDSNGPKGAGQADIGANLLAALREGRVAFAYQPVVHGDNRRAAYYETLLRILDGENGPVPASVFVPVAERLGYAQQIDRHVLNIAVAELQAHPDLRLAVNISGQTVADRVWLRRLGGLVGGRPGLARRLVVEITETAALHDFEDALRFITAVRALGCQVSLDDFGAGHTTFRHLQTFPVDMVKIDASYVNGIAQDPANQEFVDSLLRMAASFGIETVAEGVESQDDLDFLVSRGVTYLQGWALGAPVLASPAVSDTAA